MNDLTYSNVGDYRIPDLTVPQEPPVILGKYALLHKNYLKQRRRVLFVNLLTSGKLTEHLSEVEQTANERMDLITRQMATAQGVTEAFKAANQMAWVGAMNNIKACAEEIIFKEIVYA